MSHFMWMFEVHTTMCFEYTTYPMIGGAESLVFIDQTLISVIEFRLRHLHAIKNQIQ